MCLIFCLFEYIFVSFFMTILSLYFQEFDFKMSQKISEELDIDLDTIPMPSSHACSSLEVDNNLQQLQEQRLMEFSTSNPKYPPYTYPWQAQPSFTENSGNFPPYFMPCSPYMPPNNLPQRSQQFGSSRFARFKTPFILANSPSPSGSIFEYA